MGAGREDAWGQVGTAVTIQGREDRPEIISQWVAAQIASLLEARVALKKFFLKCVLICPSTRDHLHLQLLAVSSEFFPLKSIRPPGEWTVQWKERRHFLRVLFSTAQTLPQSSVLLS